MQLRISTSDGLPIYMQIASQIKHLAASGGLSPGDEIPPIRVLAQQLLINPNTVARAYLELEREGIVVKRHGSGTYISDNGSPLARKERVKIITDRIDALLVESRHLGIDPDELFKLLKERQQQIEHQEST